MTIQAIDRAIAHFPVLEECRADMTAVTEALVSMHRQGNKLLICGNGGSAADSQHIAGELLKGFLSLRPLPEDVAPGLDADLRQKLQQGIAAIPLNGLEGALSAFINDVDPALAYAQMVMALGRPGDIFLGLSTSGNAKNVCAAAQTAHALGLTTVGLTGRSGGKLAALCDMAIRVPETETYRVQELHLPVYHALCAGCEEILF